jgi:choline dehydrogenase-like flavoprotein
MRRLNIDFRYTSQDVCSVKLFHEIVDDYLTTQHIGQIEYHTRDIEASIWDQASDGFHQAGTTRMSSDTATGVVDQNCRVHGISNLFLASSSVFPTSSQANTTFMIIVLAVRLAEHLKRHYKELA